MPRRTSIASWRVFVDGVCALPPRPPRRTSITALASWRVLLEGVCARLAIAKRLSRALELDSSCTSQNMAVNLCYPPALSRSQIRARMRSAAKAAVKKRERATKAIDLWERLMLGFLRRASRKRRLQMKQLHRLKLEGVFVIDEEEFIQNTCELEYAKNEQRYESPVYPLNAYAIVHPLHEQGKMLKQYKEMNDFMKTIQEKEAADKEATVAARKKAWEEHKNETASTVKKNKHGAWRSWNPNPRRKARRKAAQAAEAFKVRMMTI